MPGFEMIGGPTSAPQTPYGIRLMIGCIADAEVEPIVFIAQEQEQKLKKSVPLLVIGALKDREELSLPAELTETGRFSFG